MPCTPRAIVLASQALVPQMRQAYPASQAGFQVVTPGVERVFGPATAAEKAQARVRLGLPALGFGILFVGNDYRKKGLGTLIQALSKLPPSCFLAVVGNPTHVPQFKAQAAAAGVAQRVHFLGSLPDVTPAYQAADCLAHPTLEDTFAMVVLEAMAHGLPVVVSGEKYCGIAGVLQPGRDALVLADPQDATALAGALEQIVRQPAMAAALQAAGLRFAQVHLWSELARQQALIYQQQASRLT